MRMLLAAAVVTLVVGPAVSSASAQVEGRVPAPAVQLVWPQTPEARALAGEPDLAELLEEPAAFPAASRSDRRTGRVLMIVGAAGVVTGLVVDESIITIAGAGVGGYGLYLYLR